MKIVLVGPSIGQSEGGILYSGGNELVTSSGPITLGIRIGNTNTYFQTKQDSNRTKPRGVLVLYRYYACIRPRTRETIYFILEKLFVERVFIVILKENIFDWNLFAAIICLVSCPICAPELGDMSR